MVARMFLASRYVWIYLGVVFVQILSLFRSYGEIPDCTRLVGVTKSVNVLVNCDSSVFMKDAQHPMRVFNGVSDYQDRPIYSLLASLVNLFFELLQLPSQNFDVIGNSGNSHVYTSTIFLSFIVINSILLFTAVFLTIAVCKKTLEDSGFNQSSRGLIISCAVAIVTLNEITKTFFWTPHTQIPNVIVPIYSIYLLLNHKRFVEKKFYRRQILAIAIGIFLYPLIGILLLIPFFSSFQSWKFKTIFSSLAAMPYLIYPLIIEFFGGEFRNVTITKYREFVWVIDVARSSDPFANFLNFLRAFLVSIPTVPTLFILVIFTISCFKSRKITYFSDSFWRNSIYFGLFYGFFTFIIGFYARRLSYGFVLYFVILAFFAILKMIPDFKYLKLGLITTLSILVALFLFSNGPMV
jgi:hypothetical protein